MRKSGSVIATATMPDQGVVGQPYESGSLRGVWPSLDVGFRSIADVDGSFETGQLGGMKRRTLLTILVALLIGILAGWAVRGFLAGDRCLDRGGAWNGDLDACKLPIGNVR